MCVCVCYHVGSQATQRATPLQPFANKMYFCYASTILVVQWSKMCYNLNNQLHYRHLEMLVFVSVSLSLRDINYCINNYYMLVTHSHTFNSHSELLGGVLQIIRGRKLSEEFTPKDIHIRHFKVYLS